MINRGERLEIIEVLWKAICDEWKAKDPMFRVLQDAQFYLWSAEREISWLIEKYGLKTVLEVAKSYFKDDKFKTIQEIVKRIERKRRSGNEHDC